MEAASWMQPLSEQLHTNYLLIECWQCKETELLCFKSACKSQPESARQRAPVMDIVMRCNAEVIAAHCTCMVGYARPLEVLTLPFMTYSNRSECCSLGEGCSHIATVLFKVECAVQARLHFCNISTMPVEQNILREGMVCKVIKGYNQYVLVHAVVTSS